MRCSPTGSIDVTFHRLNLLHPANGSPSIEIGNVAKLNAPVEVYRQTYPHISGVIIPQISTNQPKWWQRRPIKNYLPLPIKFNCEIETNGVGVVVVRFDWTSEVILMLCSVPFEIHETPSVFDPFASGFPFRENIRDSTYVWVLFHWNVDLLVERGWGALCVWQLKRFLFDAIYLEERRSDFWDLCK